MSHFSNLLRRVWMSIPHAPKATYRLVEGAPGLWLPSQEIKVSGNWRWVGRHVDGSIKFVEEANNIVVNQGLSNLLDVALSGGTAITTWYIGLSGTTPNFVAGSTLATMPTEWTNYNPPTNRGTWTESGESGQSITNNTAVTFTSSGNSQTVGGGFLASVNSGTGGTLFNGSAFSADKSLDTSETIDVTVTISASSS